MPIKKVLTSEKAVYRLRGTLGASSFGGISYFSYDPVDTLRIYDEYANWVRGMATVKHPQYPGEFEIWLYLMMKTDNWPSWSTAIAVFNGKTGAFVGFDGGGGNLEPHRLSGVGYYTVRDIFTALDGSIWGNRNNNYLVKLNRETGAFEDVLSLFVVGSNVGAIWSSGNPLAVDPQQGIIITQITADNGYSVSVCSLATGDFIRRINLSGNMRGLTIADQRIAYAIASDGTLTAFNYITGQVYGALHTGLSGTVFNHLAFSWDPFLRRLLYCPQVADTLPDGDCNLQVHGYYPIALPVGMTPPIPLQYPQKGKTVQVWNRVYGGASEGIAGQELTYTLGTGEAATVTPSRKATENNGTTTVHLTGVLAGANSITSETSVP